MTAIHDRVDSFPTHTIAGFGVRPGRALPFGATLVPGGVNFSVYSTGAEAMSLVLFHRGEREPFAELAFPGEFRVGAAWSMVVFDIGYDDVEYGFRVTGPAEPDPGDRFDPARVLADPHAKAMSGRDVWGVEPDWSDPYPYRSRLAFEDFDWEGDAPLRVPAADLVVYETHVRGFTRHASSGVASPGTYAGLLEKIPYLRELGVNCIELLPVFEFDEFEHSREANGRRLMNYWGYSTIGFYAPKAGYAATGQYGMQVDELKNLIKQLHRAGIEVMLDVVFNHTAEGDDRGPAISFRGLDNRTYYLLTPDGDYYNFSGTGNTFNCNHPVTRDFVLGALRYWAAEYHIDGFRFDLAAILDRGMDGGPLQNPPLLETLAHDPVLRDCKLVAEAWDAGGLYQVGAFPAYRRWSEWNGRFRDDVRRFLKGDDGTTGALATRLVGSPDLYAERGPVASVNFVTCHDGFSLADLVSYNEKHNEANGEDNRDGNDANESWNCGVEGPTDDPAVLALRGRQMRNALVAVLVSQGVPMLLSGDEVGRSQGGNNNGYCHDDELTWFDWSLVEANADLLAFTRDLIALRHAEPVLREERFPDGTDLAGSGYPDVSWHGVTAWAPDWSPGNRVLAVLRSAQHLPGPTALLYTAFNSHWEQHDVELPGLPDGLAWYRAVDTARGPGDDSRPPGAAERLEHQDRYPLGPRSSVVLLARAPAATGAIAVDPPEGT
jgi:glycogen operon protein